MKRMTFKACQVLLALCVLTRTVPAQEPQPGTPDLPAPAATPADAAAPEAFPTPTADAATPSDMPATLSPEGAAPQTDTSASTPVPAIPLDLPPPTQATASAPATPQLIPGNAVSVTVAQMGQPQGVIQRRPATGGHQLYSALRPGDDQRTVKPEPESLAGHGGA